MGKTQFCQKMAVHLTRVKLYCPICGTLMTPRIDAEIRRSKYRKSNFKDILRERFRNQIRANRRTLFEKMRSFDSVEDVQNSLNNILRNEIQQFDVVDPMKRNEGQSLSQTKSEREIDPDLHVELMKEIESELLNEQYQWILDEYRREEEEINSFFEESALCPLCQRGALKKCDFSDQISCTQCDLRLRFPSALNTFKESLDQKTEEHSRYCINVPQFTIMNGGDSNVLIMYCDPCHLFCTLN